MIRRSPELSMRPHLDPAVRSRALDVIEVRGLVTATELADVVLGDRRHTARARLILRRLKRDGLVRFHADGQHLTGWVLTDEARALYRKD